VAHSLHFEPAAFALLFFALLVFILFLCSLRTNVAFVLIFFLLTIAVALLAAAYWQLAQGRAELGVKLEKVSACHRRGKKDAMLTVYFQIAGGFTFALCLVGWYLLAGQLLQSVDSPVAIPVGDLSLRVPSASLRARAKAGEV